jgi:hypothetical protein
VAAVVIELFDDWVGIVFSDRVKIECMRFPIHETVYLVAKLAQKWTFASDRNLRLMLNKNNKLQRVRNVCYMMRTSLHAPTIMTLTEVMLKISRSFPCERDRICTSLQLNNGADLAVLRRIIGEESDPFLAFEDASPAAEDVVKLVDCVRSRIRVKVVWEDVTILKLGKRSVIAKSPSNTIFATELGLWFTCAEDEGDDARCVRACVNMNDVQSVQIDESDSSTCAISLHPALDSFGDASIETATSTVYVVLKNSSEAKTFIDDLQIKLDLFKELGAFARMTGLNTSMQAIEDEYTQHLKNLRKGAIKVAERVYARFKNWHKLKNVDDGVHVSALDAEYGGQPAMSKSAMFSIDFLMASLSKEELTKRLKAVLEETGSWPQGENTDKLTFIAKDIGESALQKHASLEVRLLVACIAADILRIFVPDAPYDRTQLRSIFTLFLSSFYQLCNPATLPRAFYMLERLVSVKAFSLSAAEEVSEDMLENLLATVSSICHKGVVVAAESLLADCIVHFTEECNESSMSTLLLDTFFEPISTCKNFDTNQNARVFSYSLERSPALQDAASQYLFDRMQKGVQEGGIESDLLEIIAAIDPIAPDALRLVRPALNEYVTDSFLSVEYTETHNQSSQSNDSPHCATPAAAVSFGAHTAVGAVPAATAFAPVEPQASSLAQPATASFEGLEMTDILRAFRVCAIQNLEAREVIKLW